MPHHRATNTPLEKCMLAEQRRDIDRAIMLLEDHRVSELLDKPHAGATSA